MPVKHAHGPRQVSKLGMSGLEMQPGRSGASPIRSSKSRKKWPPADPDGNPLLTGAFALVRGHPGHQMFQPNRATCCGNWRPRWGSCCVLASRSGFRCCGLPSGCRTGGVMRKRLALCCVGLVILSVGIALGISLQRPYVWGQPEALRKEDKLVEKTIDLKHAHLRVARSTDDLAALVKFYRDGLGFEVVYEFKHHDGYDGVMLGHKGAAYHLEFTRKAGHHAGRAPTEENLLVFYLPDAEQWQRAVSRLEGQGYKAAKSFNPYWDRKGKTFEDPDGYRVVLQNASWSP
jgi:catechol 2,3-dioxygenase-like lactoylglutathione lyase family enzyme